MSDVRVTSTAVKENVIWAATELMRKSGCVVQQNKIGSTVTITVTIPPESGDPHGERLKALRAKSS